MFSLRRFGSKVGQPSPDSGIHPPTNLVGTSVERKRPVENAALKESPALELAPASEKIYHIFNGVQDQFQAWWKMYNISEADRLHTPVEITKGTKSIGMSFLEQKLQGLRDAFEAWDIARPAEIAAALARVKHELELVERQIKGTVDGYILESEAQLQNTKREYADVGGVLKKKDLIVTQVRNVLDHRELETFVNLLEKEAKDLDIPKMIERIKVMTELRDSVNDLTQQIKAHFLGL